MNSIAYILITLLAFLVGQWLVTRGHWAGFLVWCAANVYSIVTCFLTDMPQTSSLFATYLVVNFASLRSWYVKSRNAAREEAGRGSATTLGQLLHGQVHSLHPAPERVEAGTTRPLAVSVG